MCGISGFWGPGFGNSHEMREVAAEMANTLRHRGPDDAGVWVDTQTGIALGHRRLAIVDLSPEGHQPMESGCGRYLIAFNGEIYNFPALREQLENSGHRFRGRSDTEVLLSSISEWGLFPALERTNGMFAFALWDRQERQLHLVRDRIGEKPLYYGWAGRTFLFGSELKALLSNPTADPEIDRDALALYLRHNYIPAPYTIYRGFQKVLPGTIVTIRSHEHSREPEVRPFWSLRDAVERSLADPFKGSEQEALDGLDALLRDAVKMRMQADVPLGAFLSGGIDSSTIVALMQAQSGRPVQTFSIGFHESEYNEATHAKAVARHLGTDHTELYVTPEEAMAVIPKLPTLYDEPFSDSSQIPTFLVSQLARRKVTVTLSGDGGDELFAGYDRYHFGRRVWNNLAWISRPLRTSGSRILASLPAQPGKALFQLLSPILPGGLGQRNPFEKFQRLSEILRAEFPETFYLSMVTHWKECASVVRNASEPPTALTDRTRWLHGRDFAEHMMYLDGISYLPDDILVKVDRASMGVSLETRVPFLDHRVVEYAWRLPLGMKIRDGKAKWILQQLLYRYVPRHLMDRPKMGFAVPIVSWLRGPLREWAESLLDEQRLKAAGIFDPAPIREKWIEHLSGRGNWHFYLWDVLMFQAWLEQSRTKSTPSLSFRA